MWASAAWATKTTIRGVLDSGSQGRTDGAYELRMDIQPDATSSIVDTDHTPQPDGTLRPATPIDGDGDAKPGGMFDYSFQVGNTNTTFFVTRPRIPRRQTVPSRTPLPKSIWPWTRPRPADPTSPNHVGDNVPVIVRIVGNSGTDGQLSTLQDNKAYLLGLDDNLGSRGALEDGGTFNVPKDVTVMIDAGAESEIAGRQHRCRLVRRGRGPQRRGRSNSGHDLRTT